MKRLLILLVLVSIFYLLPSSVAAQYGQYGGPAPSVSILIDKMVGKPSLEKGAANYDYVDNLSPSDPRFRPGQAVFFKVKIKNTSNIKLTNVTFKDFVPSYLEPIEGPGSYDAATRTITFNAGDFEAGEEKVYYIKMQIFPQDKLPADRGLFCLVNKAEAKNGGAFDDDTSQFCIEKEVLGVAKVPAAGPEMGLLLLSGEITLFGVGLMLRKRGYKI